MVTVCLKCGDRGFSELLSYCNQCQVYALHRYCLNGPVIFDEDVTWLCEDCEPIVASSLEKSPPLPSGKSSSVDLAKHAIQARIKLKNCMKRGKKKQQQQKKITKKKRKEVSEFIGKITLQLSDGCEFPHGIHAQCSKNSEKDMSEKEYGSVLRNSANSNEESDSVPISQVANNDDFKFVELDYHGDAQPVADPIWRGSLYFCKQSMRTVKGLVAHLSNLACSKVLEETKLFPEVLSADFLPRSAVWPKGFKKRGPTDQSIALYFFPENESDERVFDKLVDDIIRLDLAISVVVENADLLVFPSTVLPIQYWRFRAKYYLWGVFRGKQTSQKKNDVVSGEDTNVNKPLTCHGHSPLNSLSNSGSNGSNAQYSFSASVY